MTLFAKPGGFSASAERLPGRFRFYFAGFRSVKIRAYFFTTLRVVPSANFTMFRPFWATGRRRPSIE